jgi:ribosomal protein S3
LPVQKYFVQENARRAEIDEFLSQDLKRAGYSKVEMTKTPLGTRVVVYAAKPGLVIGRRGESIRDLTQVLEKRFGVRRNSTRKLSPPRLPWRCNGEFTSDAQRIGRCSEQSRPEP